MTGVNFLRFSKNVDADNIIIISASRFNVDFASQHFIAVDSQHRLLIKLHTLCITCYTLLIVFNSLIERLEAAIFALSDVRAAAREGIIEVPEEIQILPVTTNASIEAFCANEETLEKILKEADYAILKDLSLHTSIILDGVESDKKVAIAMLKE